MPRITIENLSEHRDNFREVKSQSDNTRVVVHLGTCGIASGAKEIFETLNHELKSRDISNIEVTTSGCAGYCSREPMITVSSPNSPPVRYVDLNEEKLITIIDQHLSGGDIASDLAFAIGTESSFMEGGTEDTEFIAAGNGNGIPSLRETDFFEHQKLLVLKNRGSLDPDSIVQYIERNGYSALAKALGELTPEKVIENILQAGLRGRGGAGFPTGRKWELCREMSGDVKYIVCNADEGDPGAFMDRSLLESDPHSVLEGMLIGAYAMGAQKGFIYVRIEYPLALRTIRNAIQQAESYGILGKGIMGSDFDFNIKVVVGAGAFVCGEETALIASIEGRVGEPRQRPPFPIQRGLWGKPTSINNVETWSNVAPIILQGPEWYNNIGTEKSKGTKIFSLVGKIINTGLVEVPMGIPLGDIVFNIGGGIPDNKKFKAVQTGGPSGGCLPIELLNLPVDYDKLAEAGSIMGSGGMVVMDEDTCMVDVARYFLTFLQ
ncbi:MAG: NADH-quinone oxidoreductase subunit F, partial [candidate division KSB1 bacterium]|nr:NADH-quinone oxidoreductase subunit F [candidate division KSB1 bacterium]